MNTYYQQAKFLQSATTTKTMPAEFGFEIAFAGRSNAGKSSTINTICHQKSLARTSKTPGRTQLLNFFSLNEGRALVDLPGYGYAKVPERIKKEWATFIESYLTNRRTLCGLVIIMDIRRPMREHDETMLAWAKKRNMPVHIILNKSDKLKRGAAKNMLLKVRRQLNTLNGEFSVQNFSSLKKEGVDEVHAVMDQWFFPKTID
jgi:GTP-binding protein